MNHSNIKCNDDKQCSNNYMCTFDDKNLNHQCKKGGQNDLYLGCLDHDVKSFDYVSSHNQDDLNNFDDCLSFSRKQTNKDGMNHNYFLFKKKKVSSVDLSSINIYLLCGNKILLHSLLKIILNHLVIMIIKIVNFKQKKYFLILLKSIKKIVMKIYI